MPHPTFLRTSAHLDLRADDPGSTSRTTQEMLQGMREARLRDLESTRHPGRTRRPIGPVEQKVLSAAVCLTANLPDPERHFAPEILELADRDYGDMGLKRILLEGAQANGFDEYSVSYGLGDALKAGFSTMALPGILSDVANKFLAAGFDSVESSWREIASRTSVPDFKPVSSYRLTGNATYERVPPGGEIKHGQLGEEKFHNQADTYGRMFTISRTDIINDDLSALTTVPKKLGRGAALKLNEVFWSKFLDHASFFSAEHGNLLVGADTALSIDGLTKAETSFLDKTDPDGMPLGIQPRILLVPTPLGVPASALMTSLEIRQTIADTSYPTANPHTGKFRVVRSAYLSSTHLAGSSPTAWYLLGDPNDLPVIEVAFLHGQERPTIEDAKADFSVLGVQMRGYHDFGVALQDHRGGVKMAGK